MDAYSYYSYIERPKCSKWNVGGKPMARAVGLLLLFELLAMSLSCIVSLLYGEGDWFSFAISMVVCALVGGGLFMYGHNISGRSRDIKLSSSESYIIVALSWVFFSIFGMLPYLVSGYIPSVTDAFFETMSGFTTTGATILDDIESLPHGILFWRSLTQWIGGLGIVCFTIALLPNFGSSSQMLFLSEATGVTHDKIHPRITVMARYIWTVYFALTAIEAVLLMIEGMDFFDAVCHSFTTTATGGFSTKQDSIAYWNSPVIEYTVTLFMLLSAINFSLYLGVLKGRFSQLTRNVEVRWFLSSVGVLTAVITVTLILQNGYGIEEAFRKSVF